MASVQLAVVVLDMMPPCVICGCRMPFVDNLIPRRPLFVPVAWPQQ
jgi:hypothetical protein